MRNTLNGESIYLGLSARSRAIVRLSAWLATVLLGLAGTLPAALHAQAITNTATALNLVPNPASINQAVAANVEVTAVLERQSGALAPSGSAPSGTVTVSGGSQSCTATLTSGLGSCTLSFPVPGVYTITATYPGDVSFSPSSTSQTLTVNGPAGTAAVPAPTLSAGMLALLGAMLAALVFFVPRRNAR